jgi:hypothetical protein
MKQFVEAIPFALLLAVVPYFFYNTPNISQSIIVFALSALCGYRYYIMEKQQPDYIKLFRKELVRIEANSKELKDNYGKITMQDIKKSEKSKFVF